MEETNRDPKAAKSTPNPAAPYAVLNCVIPYISDQKDRNAVSLVCRWCRDVDSLTRKRLTVGLGFGLALTPDRVRRRFGRLESLKIKAKAWRASFNGPVDWSIYITPWVKEIGENFSQLESLHFMRTPVRDLDLELLAMSRGEMLRVLKIDKCKGFSTDGLLHIGRYCRQLRTLFLEGSKIVEKDGEWLHQLAMNNSVLESLNFHMTYLDKFSVKDLEFLAKNCGSLVSVKVSHMEIYNLADFFRAATVLEEICGVFVGDQWQNNYDLPLPRRLCHLGFLWLGKIEMPILFPFATSLRKLDLLNALAGTEEDQCLLIQRCPNLETLEAGNAIGDRGIEVIAQTCKRLKRLRIGESASEIGPRGKEGAISEKGLIALAQGCLELEYLALYIPDITNAALEYIGTHLNNLCDFRLLLLDQEERTTDSPLDNGVRALLNRCRKLRRIALYLRPGSLTDLELCFISHFRPNIRWKHLK